jgi:cytochrome c-type biogenesis protein CcmH
MKKYAISVLYLCLVVFYTSTFGQEKINDIEIQTRISSLSQELRCLVCQNQTLAESNTPLARDLRNQIKTLMQEGMTDQQVLEYLVARYGDFVRYRPPFKGKTAILWLAPFILLIFSLCTLLYTIKNRNSQR